MSTETRVAAIKAPFKSVKYTRITAWLIQLQSGVHMMLVYFRKEFLVVIYFRFIIQQPRAITDCVWGGFRTKNYQQEEKNSEEREKIHTQLME